MNIITTHPIAPVIALSIDFIGENQRYRQKSEQQNLCIHYCGDHEIKSNHLSEDPHAK